jgi:hypothetical protein
MLQAEGLIAKLTNKLIGEKTGNQSIGEDRRKCFIENPVKATADVMQDFLKRKATVIILRENNGDGVETKKNLRTNILINQSNRINGVKEFC